MRRSWHLKYSIRDKEVGSILLRHQIKKYPDLASIRFRIDSSVFRHFHTGARVKTLRIGMLAWLTGYVWAEAVSGKEKLRIQKYPDTCGRLAITKSLLILYVIDRAGRNNYEF